MPLEVRWFDDEETILYAHLSGVTTNDDYLMLPKKSWELAENAPHDIYQIASVIDVKVIPRGLLGLFTQIASHPINRHARTRQRFIIVPNVMTARFIEILLSVGKPRSTTILRSLDEALRRIEQDKQARKASGS